MKQQYMPEALRYSYLRQHLVFSSSSHVAALQSESPFWLVLCLKLFDISSSSSPLELQFEVTKSYCVPSFNLEKWHSSSWITSTLQLVLLGFAKANGPDRLAGVLWRWGDELLIGVWHLEVVELPRGVISVPTSLCWTSLATSVQASCIASPAGFLNKNPSLVGSEYLKPGKTGSMLSVNLSALQFTICQQVVSLVKFNSIIPFSFKCTSNRYYTWELISLSYKSQLDAVSIEVTIIMLNRLEHKEIWTCGNFESSTNPQFWVHVITTKSF